MKIHEKYIKRCIELAQNGLGSTYPNPMVGSVIVHNNKIIGEGWHKKAGEPHAEVIAINNVKDKSLLSTSTIYVSLEPCSHFGKTPPCADLIIKHKIPNVVIGTIDSFAKVAGNGIKKLIEAGINVTVGILEEECNILNRRFFTFHNKKRPYVILKWAESEDGFISPTTKESQKPVWISNEYSRQLVHKWRSEEQSILVGTKTVLDDNPSLDTRNWKGNDPVRIILDKTGAITDSHQVKNKKQPTFVISEVTDFSNSNNLSYKNIIFDSDVIKNICIFLFENNIQSVIIEGGKKTIQSFIDNNLWDEARVFTSNVILNNGTPAPTIKKKKSQSIKILNDELNIYFNHD